MGAKIPKNEKVPYQILVGMRDKEKNTFLKAKNNYQEGEILNAKASKGVKRLASGKLKYQSAVYSNHNLFPSSSESKLSKNRGIKETSVGKYKAGTLYLGKKDVERIQNSGKLKKKNFSGKDKKKSTR
eukprot:Sdes_comp16262_c0_seq2m5564